jgi:pyruvate dehydrogenase E2 component (dihydrolipoamide acetyltransferase)
MVEFKFPDVGEGIMEGEVVEWLVKVGDTVAEDQDIVKVETDKAVVDLPSPASGKVVKIFKKAGETVKVGEVLVQIGGASKAVKEKPKKSSSVVGELEVAQDEPKKKKVSKVKSIKKTATTKKSSGKALALPAVRKLAAELGVDLSTVTGSGPKGRVLAKDLKFALSKESSASSESAPTKTKSSVPRVVKKYDMWGYVDRIPLKGVRKAIKENMEMQARIPTVTHMDDIDVTDLYYLRKKEKKNMPEGVNLTFLPFVMKAVILAAKKFPIVYGVIDGDDIVVKKYHNIGIAVATTVGLMVPIVKGADKKSIHSLAEEIQGLAEKARKRELDLMDFKGGSFTITNVGSIGGTYATPILNPGESSILALGRIQDKPLVFGKRIKSVKIRKVLPISLTFDHSVYDGAEAARFANAVKEYLEDPHFLLLDMA